MLERRTFHPDEANQAFTAGRLLETGRYVYNPSDHHGPTLYFAAAPLQRLAGASSTATLDGSALRATPLLFAVLALLFLGAAIFRAVRMNGSGRISAFAASSAAALLAGSAPMFFFYSTYFIQEMLLVAFTAMALWSAAGFANSLSSPSARLKPGTWALFGGAAAGLAFATKETSLIAFACCAAAALPFLAARKFFPAPAAAPSPSGRRLSLPSVAVLAVVSFAIVSCTLYSSFFSNFSPLFDAFVRAPLNYLGRAAGDSAASEGASWHVHPWWKHLEWLLAGKFFSPDPKTPSAPFLAFSNAIPLLQILLMLPFAVRAKMKALRECSPAPLANLFIFLSLYTAAAAAVYSAIPYKTPWCTLQILFPMLAAAAAGFAFCRESFAAALARRGIPARRAALASGAVFFAALPLCAILPSHVTGIRAILADPDSAAIPYNYAHASPEAKELAECVRKAVADSKSPSPFIAAALPPCDTWPFPWYNRALEHRTGYWTRFEDLEKLAASGAKPDVVLVPMSQGHLVQPLFPHLKNTKRFRMRPRVRIRVFW